MSFAVIELDQSYELVEGAKCIKGNLTEQEANDLVKKMKDQEAVSWKQREDYLKEFVNNIDIPENLGYQGWKEFIKQFFGPNCRYVFPKDFQKELIGYLRTYHLELEGYDPPIVPYWPVNLFVVEIKTSFSPASP